MANFFCSFKKLNLNFDDYELYMINAISKSEKISAIFGGRLFDVLLNEQGKHIFYLSQIEYMKDNKLTDLIVKYILDI